MIFRSRANGPIGTPSRRQNSDLASGTLCACEVLVELMAIKINGATPGWLNGSDTRISKPIS